MKQKIRIGKAISLYISRFAKMHSVIETILSSIICLCLILLIDITNFPSEFVDRQRLELLIILAALIITIVQLWLVRIGFFELLKFPVVTNADLNIVRVFMISGLCAFVYFLNNEITNYKVIISISLFIIFALIVLARSMVCCDTLESRNGSYRSIFDLKDIFYNSFNVNKSEPILISEKEADYDLLDRSGCINHLYNAIITYNPERSFVIGLIGEWGIGKTTLLNNVKSKIKGNNNDDSSIIIIDDFDPWLFGTQDALLVSMFDIILQHTGIKCSVAQNRNFTKRIRATIAGISKSLMNSSAIDDIFSLLFSNNDVCDDINTLKEEMSAYLKAQNKTIVFLIDNIDRAEADNIICLFKLITTIFDLPNIIYILSYDKERIIDILNDTKKINPKYIEKIIQQEIFVPRVRYDKMRELCKTCVENILIKYDVDPEEIKTYIPILEVICAEVDNLRNFKRLVNTVLSSVFTINHKLNKYDLLAIEVIRFLEPALYDAIQTNSIFFISHDIEYHENTISIMLRTEEFNSNGIQFLSDLLAKYPAYKELLSSVFPYVKRYSGNYELRSKYGNDIKESGNVEKKMSICSAKYFDLYFSYGENDFLSMGAKIQDVFKLIKSKKPSDAICDSFCDLINSVVPDEHKVLFEAIQQYISDVPQEYAMALTSAIWDSIPIINDTKHFMALSAKGRAKYIISILVEKANIDEVRVFASDICKDLSRLCDVSDIIYWLEHSKLEDTTNTLECKQIFQDAYAKTCKDIIENKINIYEDPNYSMHNIWGLYRFYKYDERKDEVLSIYMRDIFLSKYVYRYIGDVIIQSIGTYGYGYSIDSESFKSHYFDETMIDSALEKCAPKSDSERFVLKVYNKYKCGDSDLIGEKGINLSTEMRLDL